MKRKLRKIVIIILAFAIGIAVGMAVGYFIPKKVQNNSEIDVLYSETTAFMDSIKNSEYGSEEINNKLDALNKLYDLLDTIQVKRDEVEEKIIKLEHEINNSTNFEYADEIFETGAGSSEIEENDTSETELEDNSELENEESEEN